MHLQYIVDVKLMVGTEASWYISKDAAGLPLGHVAVGTGTL